MSTWKDYVAQHTMTAERAVQLVKSGDHVVFSHACGEPRCLPGALVQRAGELKDVKIAHMVSMGESLYCRPEYAGSFRHMALFAGGSSRGAIADGRADYMPTFFSRIPDALQRWGIDVAMVTVSPPDKNGCCSLGVSVDFTRRAVESARTVIAEINPTMPRTHGDSFISVSEIDCFVESDKPILELNSGAIPPEEQAVGAQVAKLVDDGCCLQLGIGGIPDAVLSNLGHLKDLGIHSEMISNGVKALVEKGIINCCKKSLHKGKMVVTFIMGSREFYDWIDDNPMIEMHTVDYTNNSYVIAQNRKMISINSAIEVDLLGQACADTMGPKQYSGVGGQVDFVRGASMSEGGKAIIALPSTAKNGTISKIVPVIKTGAAVTTSRNDIDYVVTDCGIAQLRGKTVAERMKALIAIAAPQFQEELAKQAFEIYGKASGL